MNDGPYSTTESSNLLEMFSEVPHVKNLKLMVSSIRYRYTSIWIVRPNLRIESLAYKKNQILFTGFLQNERLLFIILRSEGLVKLSPVI